ncbi:hypothetical protein NDU88_008190 [Pleurodeles waltl]|uniref:Uncharacterized protein n=1 Tax=Pleurodeles waltl TaxID=8319 RepID=A0AAV7RTY4_PLEWA|nr:hypothetical protein NDU88_008190 [Pleurodeles waltl]
MTQGVHSTYTTTLNSKELWHYSCEKTVSAKRSLVKQAHIYCNSNIWVHTCWHQAKAHLQKVKRWKASAIGTRYSTVKVSREDASSEPRL